MASSVESLLEDAGVAFEVPSNPMTIWGADAIYNGDLSSLPLDVNEQGELLVQLDNLSETLKVEVGGELACEEGQAIKIKEEQRIDGEMVEDFEEEGVQDYAAEEVENYEEEDKNFKKCPHCDKSKHKKSLRRHIKLVHQSIKLKCDLCGLKVTNEEKLRIHIEKVHCEKDGERVKCNFCEKTFSDMQKARFHETTKHNELAENPFQCPACEKTFKTKPNMQRHVRGKHYL